MHVNIINPSAWKNALDQLDCEKTKFALLDNKDFEIYYSNVNPPDGYETPENFPNCCSYHTTSFLNIQKWHNKFPNCCESHRKLIHASWFNKLHYLYVADKTVNQLAYTECQIKKEINSPNWYKEITDYIHYNYLSFGQLPSGFGSAPGLSFYLDNLKHWVEKAHGKDALFPTDKRKRIIEFIENYYRTEKSYQIDLNLLYNTYRKWVELFPFNIDYFKHLKERFDKHLPIAIGEPYFNKYTKQATVKIATQSELIENLIGLTKKLLREFNSSAYIGQGLITDTKKHRFTLVSEQHRIKQESLLLDFIKHEMKYVNIVMKWLKNESEFFEKIYVTLEDLVPKPLETIKQNSQIEKTVHRIHFSDRSGTEFERLTFAFVSRQKEWSAINWLGETGKDGGRDIWGVHNEETYCYQCANYAQLTLKKAKEDIDKLSKNKSIPNNLIVVCGGKVSVKLREKIKKQANTIGIKQVEIWSGVEFEEVLRKDTPELIKRFFEGVPFPEK